MSRRIFANHPFPRARCPRPSPPAGERRLRPRSPRRAFDPRASDDDATCMAVSGDLHAGRPARPGSRAFTDRPLADARRPNGGPACVCRGRGADGLVARAP